MFPLTWTNDSFLTDNENNNIFSTGKALTDHQTAKLNFLFSTDHLNRDMIYGRTPKNMQRRTKKKSEVVRSDRIGSNFDHPDIRFR